MSEKSDSSFANQYWANSADVWVVIIPHGTDKLTFCLILKMNWNEEEEKKRIGELWILKVETYVSAEFQFLSDQTFFERSNKDIGSFRF